MSGTRSYHDHIDLLSIPERLKALGNSLNGIENEIQNIVACRDLVSQLKPLLFKRQIQVNHVIHQLHEFNSRK